MKKKTTVVILVIFCLFIVSDMPAFASELFGRISTNPSDVGGGTGGDSGNEDIATGEDTSPSFSGNSASSNSSSYLINKKQTRTKEVIVKGFEYYVDGTLVRDKDKKIYFIQGEVKKHILNLEELKKHAGESIIDISDDSLSNYENRNYLNGDLIREIGDVKVYIIKNGLRRHILNLEELREHYVGKEIFNLSREEMKLY